MNIRPFSWRDLPLLHRYRNQGLFLDSASMSIHGPNLIPMGAVLTFLAPSTRIYTYHCDNQSAGGRPIIGQLAYAMGSVYARLSYLAPENEIDMSDLATLVDYMAAQMGNQGAFHILADLDETSQVYHFLRRAGFVIYARQSIWKLEGEASGDAEEVNWRASKPVDVIGVRSLYCNVVPGLVQQVEPLPDKNLKGVIYYQDGELRAYVELKYGRNGIWVQPFVHPDVQGFDRPLVYLLRNLPSRHERPLFICVRSYQSWLEAAIDAIGAQPGPQQAVMVRHLTVSQRVKQRYKLPAINGTRVEPTAPIARMDSKMIFERAEVDKKQGTD